MTRFTPTIIPDEHRPVRPRNGATIEAFETVLNGAERALTDRGAWDEATARLIAKARIIRRNLGREQALDPRYADLHRRLDELEYLRRTARNPLGDVQARIGAALARLAQEPPSDLTRDLTQLLTTPEDT